MKDGDQHRDSISRRRFIKGAAALTAAATLGSPLARGAGAAADRPAEPLRVGVIGCGTRGRIDTNKLLEAMPGARVTAMGDLFPDKLDTCLEFLTGRWPDRIDVPPSRRFLGLDAFGEVLAADIDLVLLLAPQFFRPEHFGAAVEAGRHVFMEKPLAVDPVALRSIMETARLADERGLKVVVGTQMWRIAHVVEGMKRLHDGAIGRVTGGSIFRIDHAMSDWGPKERDPAWSDVEWQIRRFFFIDWLCGDFMIDHSIHNIDLMEFALQARARECFGVGGRQSLQGDHTGNIYDHMAIEYAYEDDLRIQYQGAFMDGVSHRNNQRLVGERGNAYFDFRTFRIENENGTWEYDGPGNDPMVAQFEALERAITRNEPLNDAHRVAEANLTALMGRMSAHTGRALSRGWVLNGSRQRLGPERVELGPYELSPPPRPGITRLV